VVTPLGSLTALIGGLYGYEVVGVDSVEKMLEEMGIPEGASPDAEPVNKFRLYLMDTNLEKPMANTYEPVSRVYPHVREDVEKKEAYFMSITGNAILRSEAEKAGIPCASGPEIDKFLVGLQKKRVENS